MKFYRFEVISSTGNRMTTQVFSNEEVKAKKVFDVIINFTRGKRTRKKR